MQENRVCKSYGCENSPLPKPCKCCGDYYCNPHQIGHRIIAVNIGFTPKTSEMLANAIGREVKKAVSENE